MPQPPILLKKGLWYRCFPVNFVKFKNTFLTGHLGATASVFKKSFYFRNMKNILNLGCSSFKYEAYSDKLLYKKFVDSIFCFPIMIQKFAQQMEAILKTIFHSFPELTSKIFEKK